MWAWIIGAVGVLGVGGSIAALILVPGLAPIVAEIAVKALATVVRAITSAASWCLRQAIASPAWTGVLAAAVVVAWIVSGSIGDGRGDTRGYARGVAVGARALETCHGNVGRLESAIKDRNAEIIARGKEGDALRAELATKAAKNREEIEALRARLAALAASKPAGKNECERAASARAQILEDRSR